MEVITTFKDNVETAFRINNINKNTFLHKKQQINLIFLEEFRKIFGSLDKELTAEKWKLIKKAFEAIGIKKEDIPEFNELIKAGKAKNATMNKLLTNFNTVRGKLKHVSQRGGGGVEESKEGDWDEAERGPSLREAEGGPPPREAERGPPLREAERGPPREAERGPVAVPGSRRNTTRAQPTSGSSSASRAIEGQVQQLVGSIAETALRVHVDEEQKKQVAEKALGFFGTIGSAITGFLENISWGITSIISGDEASGAAYRAEQIRNDMTAEAAKAARVAATLAAENRAFEAAKLRLETNPTSDYASAKKELFNALDSKDEKWAKEAQKKIDDAINTETKRSPPKAPHFEWNWNKYFDEQIAKMPDDAIGKWQAERARQEQIAEQGFFVGIIGAAVTLTTIAAVKYVYESIYGISPRHVEIIEAIKTRNLPFIKSIQKSQLLCYLDTTNNNPLHYAIHFGADEIASYLIENCKPLVGVMNACLETPLFTACLTRLDSNFQDRNNNIARQILLLGDDVNIDYVNFMMRTPLLAACINQNAELAIALLEFKIEREENIDLFVYDNQGHSVLSIVNRYDTLNDLREYLATHYPNIHNLREINSAKLYYLIKIAAYEAALQFINDTPNINWEYSPASFDFKPFLNIILQISPDRSISPSVTKIFEDLQLLIYTRMVITNSDLLEEDFEGITPLMHLLFNGRGNLARILIEKGANVNNNSFNKIKFIKINKMNFKIKNSRAQDNALKFRKNVSWLATYQPIGIEVIDSETQEEQHEKFLQIHALHFEGESPLTLASMNGLTCIVNLLLEKGAEIEFKNANNKTAYTLALEKKNIYTAAALQLKMTISEEEKSTALEIMRRGVCKLAKCIFDRFNEKTNFYNNILTELDTLKYDPDTLKFTYVYKYITENFDGDGSSWALNNNKLEEILAYIKTGVDLNALENNNVSILHHACFTAGAGIAHNEIKRELCVWSAEGLIGLLTAFHLNDGSFRVDDREAMLKALERIPILSALLMNSKLYKEDNIPQSVVDIIGMVRIIKERCQVIIDYDSNTIINEIIKAGANVSIKAKNSNETIIKSMKTHRVCFRKLSMWEKDNSGDITVENILRKNGGVEIFANEDIELDLYKVFFPKFRSNAGCNNKNKSPFFQVQDDVNKTDMCISPRLQGSLV